jgi:predicted membrane-bound spermidine synthase
VHDYCGSSALKNCPLVLFISVALIATGGLVYEPVTGTRASHLLGDVRVSTVIGGELSAMGVAARLVSIEAAVSPQ